MIVYVREWIVKPHHHYNGRRVKGQLGPTAGRAELSPLSINRDDRVGEARGKVTTVLTRWFGGTGGGRLPPNPCPGYPRRSRVCPQTRVGRKKCAPSAAGCPQTRVRGYPSAAVFLTPKPSCPQTIVSVRYRCRIEHTYLEAGACL
jgi:hypothetical protein